MKKERKMPCAAARVFAFLTALALVLTLGVTMAGLLGVQVMTSPALYNRAASNPEVLDRQMARIEEKIRQAAEEYGFAPETLIPLVRRESVEGLNREIAAWATDFGTRGKTGPLPVFYLSGGEEALRADENWTSGMDPRMVKSMAETITLRVSEKIRKTSVLFRDSLLQSLISKVGARLPLGTLFATVRKIPPVAALASLMLAGVIALLMSRNIRYAGRYIGGAMGACGLLMLLGLLMVKRINIQGMIAEASEIFAMQYRIVAGTLTWETVGMAAALILLGAGGLFLAARARKDAGS